MSCLSEAFKTQQQTFTSPLHSRTHEFGGVTCHKRGKRSDDGDEPGQDHRFAAVLAVERLRLLDVLLETLSFWV